MPKYFFDNENFNFGKVTRSVRAILLTCLKYLIVTVSVAVVFYIVLSFFFSTDTERRLRRENRMYAKLYPELKSRDKLLGDVVAGLQVKDNNIYRGLFNTDAPVRSPILSLQDSISGQLSLPEDKIVRYTDRKIKRLENHVAIVMANFQKIYSRSDSSSAVFPPLSLPIRNLSYSNVGASVGQKMSPFYKVMSLHEGVDLISQQGEPVYATGDGVVTDVNRSSKTGGNTVEIDNGGGYVTRFSHLQDISVSKGGKVSPQTRIGSVGNSGKSFGPHLHYEVRRNGVCENPVNYFFASIDSDDYIKMIYMSESTGQTMD